MKHNNEQRIQAVALTYKEKTENSPKVIAKGKGVVAENIIETAKSSNIPIQEDPSLVELLGKLEINETIPEDLYQAVAEVFSFVYRLDQNMDNE
ncbi:EscU/YscU/HrcU family type III secretion system export apparatus switch protein [Bacillus solimangrovi]|uniref:Type III secretion system protein n=1 Tax=Bacillus solimangrovi TaxID=1305675 RepID=A0A1E5LAZ0_9BACI|nr:EscU/YscU/HrcU family type III secretion system export apparatus switch protein [Bacillus solimangrovi]OEH91246.1 type III secretion system protein [Bacillus solimangrovi]